MEPRCVATSPTCRNAFAIAAAPSASDHASRRYSTAARASSDASACSDATFAATAGVCFPTDASPATTLGVSAGSAAAAYRRSIAATRALASGGTPVLTHPDASTLRWFSVTLGSRPRSTSASQTHFTHSASAIEGSAPSFGAMTSKSAWTCSRGSPPRPPFTLPSPSGPAGFSPPPPPPDRNVIPTQHARSDVASSAATCRTIAERKSRRKTTSAPDRVRRRCPSSPAAAPPPPPPPPPSRAHDTTRDDSGDAPCLRNAARSVASIFSPAAPSTASGAPLSAAAALAATRAPALPSPSSRSTTRSCSAPPFSTAVKTSSRASSPPFGGRNPLLRTSVADGRSFGSGDSNAVTRALCAGYFARKSAGRRSLPLFPGTGGARSAFNSTARSIPVENRRNIS
eukprot:7872-Pelagococcus_subviridis.AAC.2